LKIRCGTIVDNIVINLYVKFDYTDCGLHLCCWQSMRVSFYFKTIMP